MSNLKDRLTNEEWDALELSIKVKGESREKARNKTKRRIDLEEFEDVYFKHKSKKK